MEDNDKEKAIKKWEESGVLDGLTEMDKDNPMIKPFESPTEQKITELSMMPIVKRVLDQIPEGVDLVGYNKNTEDND